MSAVWRGCAACLAAASESELRVVETTVVGIVCGSTVWFYRKCVGCAMRGTTRDAALHCTLSPCGAVSCTNPLAGRPAHTSTHLKHTEPPTRTNKWTVAPVRPLRARFLIGREEDVASRCQHPPSPPPPPPAAQQPAEELQHPPAGAVPAAAPTGQSDPAAAAHEPGWLRDGCAPISCRCCTFSGMRPKPVQAAAWLTTRAPATPGMPANLALWAEHDTARPR